MRSCFRAARPSGSRPPAASPTGCAPSAAASGPRGGAGADRAGGDPLRPRQRRRQGLGREPLSGARRRGPRRGPRQRDRLRARQRRRRHRGDDGDADGRARLGVARHRERGHGRRPRGGQRLRHRLPARQPAFLGGALRDRRRVRRPRAGPRRRGAHHPAADEARAAGAVRRTRRSPSSRPTPPSTRPACAASRRWRRPGWRGRSCRPTPPSTATSSLPSRPARARRPIRSRRSPSAHAAALCLSRAIARGVHAARPMPGNLLPCWSELPSG